MFFDQGIWKLEGFRWAWPGQRSDPPHYCKVGAACSHLTNCYGRSTNWSTNWLFCQSVDQLHPRLNFHHIKQLWTSFPQQIRLNRSQNNKSSMELFLLKCFLLEENGHWKTYWHCSMAIVAEFFLRNLLSCNKKVTRESRTGISLGEPQLKTGRQVAPPHPASQLRCHQTLWM